MGKSECTLSTTQRQNIITVLPMLVECLTSPVFLDTLAEDGLKVDWKAFSDMLEDITNKPLFVK